MDAYKNLKRSLYLIPNQNVNLFFRIKSLSYPAPEYSFVGGDFGDRYLLKVNDIFAIFKHGVPLNNYLVKVKNIHVGGVQVCLANDTTKGLPAGVFNPASDIIVGFKLVTWLGRCFNGTSLAFVKQSSSYPTIIHEFLHMHTVGALEHVGKPDYKSIEKGNVMYPEAAGGKKLRFRQLPIYEKETETYCQWEKLHP